MLIEVSFPFLSFGHVLVRIYVLKANRICLYYLFNPAQNVFAEIPVISPALINGSYIEGSSVNISCTATGKPDPEVSWVRNGQIYSSGRKTAHLTFDAINRTDDGLYTCTANNAVGTKTHKETLVVRCESESLFLFTSLSQSFHLGVLKGARRPTVSYETWTFSI